MDTFTTITHDTCAGVIGGMNVDDLPLSDNIEDRRGETMTYWQRVWARLGPQPRPIPAPPHDPNDKMAHDLGYDDIGKPPLRR